MYIGYIYLFKCDSITIDYNLKKGDRSVIASKVVVNQRAQQSILVENLRSHLQNGETV